MFILAVTIFGIISFYFAFFAFKRYLLKTTPSISLPIFSSLYTHELRIAQLAVQRAALLTEHVFHKEVKDTLDKHDKSPVTVGDFGAQALIIAALRHHFPEDAIVAEEESFHLLEKPELQDIVWNLVKNTKLDDPEAEALLGGAIRDIDAMLDLIDRGNSPGGNTGRIWVIDPIDGTKGFLRGGQYSVCLGLLVDGEVRVGVLGCPNLPIDLSIKMSDSGQLDAKQSRGVLFSAIENKGAIAQPIREGALFNQSKLITMHDLNNLTEATLCARVEASHAANCDQALISQQLGITRPNICMDSQAKYASIARGLGDIYLRLPLEDTYEEKIWDHAAGALIVHESGGKVTDIYGKDLDFSRGRTLSNNKGVVAAPWAIHGKVLKAVQTVLKIHK